MEQNFGAQAGELLSGKTVAIMGVGLIGGSIGAALKQDGSVRKVLGFDLSRQAIDQAIEMGIIDAGDVAPSDALQEADLVIVSVPVEQIPGVIGETIPFLPDGCVITDTGSTKAGILRKMEEILPGRLIFIGGHPMAGGEQAGVAAADPYLMQNAVYVITPPKSAMDRRIRRGLELVSALVEVLGAHRYIISAGEHDRIVAAVSHLPHLTAVALVNAVGKLAESDERFLAFAAGGFRDTTRIASSSALIWRDICLSNRAPLLEMIRLLQAELGELAATLEGCDAERLGERLERARQVRATIPARRKGILSPMREIVIQVQDRPGAINEVTSLLAAEKINIRDIEILRVREREGGSLLLAFEGEEPLEKAVSLLKTHGFSARRR
ncbi:MAG: prephenate dehydrogenase [Firmicutes bacterium]|nr:prephenate dehydrogenase [Bacillota bacterium]